MITTFIFGMVAGIAFDQANTRGWLKLAYDKAKAKWFAKDAAK